MLLNLGKWRFAIPSLPFTSILFYGFDYWLWGDSLVDWKKGPELALTSYFKTTSFFLYFPIFNIMINSIKNQWFKCSVVRRRKGLGEFGIALLHVIEVGYNTPHRRRAEIIKRFGLASLGRYSNLRIKLYRETIWQTDTYRKTGLERLYRLQQI